MALAEHREAAHPGHLHVDLSAEGARPVPFDRWEALIFSQSGPIVWARGEYEKSGIVPYVHERGTRIPSLRRIVRKWPYFTNGSARSIEDVLTSVAVTSDRFFHANAPAEALRLDRNERAALHAFLRLL